MYLGVDISEMQLFRMSDYYGDCLSETLDSNERLLPVSDKEEVVYAMGDGSMILTREEQWKEVKLGRIFREKDCVQPAGKVGKIRQSQYVSHLGNCTDFTEKMERVLDSYGNINERLVFITDGAVWLRNWIADAYPKAVSILDFYHAKEYLCDFAKVYFKDEKERKLWVEQQSALLLESKTGQVIETLKTLSKRQQNKEAADKIINYYTDNLERMDYKRYQTIGKGLIGSGAMESSHRTVIQCRMKLSGQRWSKKGAKNMLCLRTLKMNKQWNKVMEAIQQHAAYKIAA
jgi:hypothetical protein